MEEVAGKVVWITGASSGIGAGIAREFAKRGAQLILTARRVERLQQLASELGLGQGQVLTFACDVASDKDCDQVVELAHRSFGPIDIVIANAGFGVVGSLGKLSIADYQRQFETNVFGVLRTVKAALPDLKKTRGRLGIVGSVNGYLALPGNSPYAMSKYAVRALAESLRTELKGAGISVTHIAPGFVKSEIRKVDNSGAFHENAQDVIPDWLQMPTQVAAAKITRAVVGRKRERVLTGHGQFAVWLVRFFPWLYFWIIGSFGIRARSEP